MRTRSLSLRIARLLAALAAVVCAAILAAGAALACPVCMPPDKVTLSGPGLSGTVTITDSTTLSYFGYPDFFGSTDRTPVAAPHVTGGGYEVIRYYGGNTGLPESYWTQGFDHLRYYLPDASSAESHGLIFYEGPTAGDTQGFANALGLTAYTGRWFAATLEEENAIRAARAVADGGVATSTAAAPEAVPGTHPGAQSSSGQLPIILALVAGALGVMLLGGAAHRRTRQPAPAADDAAPEDATREPAPTRS